MSVRRHPPRLRLDVAARGRAATTTATSRSTTATSRPGRRRSSRRRRAANTMTGRKSASSTSPPTARGSSSARRSPPTVGERLLAALHAHRVLAGLGRTHPRHDDRRPLRRHVRPTEAGSSSRPRTNSSPGTPTPAPTSTRPRSPGSGSITPQLISVVTGGPSNDDGCEPIGSPTSWNVRLRVGQMRRGGLAGGAGVAADGTAYFLSPEQLDGGDGEAGAPNLYVVRAGRHVAVLRRDDRQHDRPSSRCRRPITRSSTADPDHRAFGTRTRSPSTRATATSTSRRSGSNSVSRYTAAGARPELHRRPQRRHQRAHRPGIPRRRGGPDRGRQLRRPDERQPLHDRRLRRR